MPYGSFNNRIHLDGDSSECRAGVLCVCNRVFHADDGILWIEFAKQIRSACFVGRLTALWVRIPRRNLPLRPQKLCSSTRTPCCCSGSDNVAQALNPTNIVSLIAFAETMSTGLLFTASQRRPHGLRLTSPIIHPHGYVELLWYPLPSTLSRALLLE